MGRNRGDGQRTVVERVQVAERLRRPWVIPPDQPDGTLSRDALIVALIDAATLLDIAGGCLEVVVGRVPSAMPGAMTMNSAALCWKSRTDAYGDFESPVSVLPDVEPEGIDYEQAADALRELDGEAEAREQAEDVPLPDVSPVDGFDYSQLDEEDVEEPVSAS